MLLLSNWYTGSALRFWNISGTCTVKGREIGGFGGSQLEHPRQMLGAQWVGLFLRVQSPI